MAPPSVSRDSLGVHRFKSQLDVGRTPSTFANRMSPDTIIEKLSAIYGEFEQTPRYNALDELIFTVLTQHTSDLNAERAFDRLREAIPTWEEVMVADQQLIADAIFHGGMSNQKSKRIKDILATILERHGELEIEFLRNYELEDARTVVGGIAQELVPKQRLW